jgi:hypothetical protein
MTNTLAAAITERLDEMGDNATTLRAEQIVDGHRADLDLILAAGTDLTWLADDLGVGLDTGELPLDPPIHMALLTTARQRALQIAREASAGVVSEVRTGPVAS